MTTLDVDLGDRSYRVLVAPGALADLGAYVRASAPHGRALLAVDSAISETHGRVAEGSLEREGFDVCTVSITADEKRKRLDAVESLYDAALTAGLERASPFVALGGGLTGDVVGFAAATYLRGVPVIQAPTTLLAAVDASVGGKTGVNHPVPGGGLGKNLIGAFWQPRAVIIDPLTLRTLPDRELRCGLAECLKHAILADADHLDWIAAHVPRILDRDEHALVELIAHSVRIKASVVAADEREAGVRAHLNLGHTFAHAIEPIPDLGLQHGEAVGLGLIAAAWCAAESGRMTPGERDRVAAAVRGAGLPDRLAAPLPAETLVEAMRFDKKVRDGGIRLVLPVGLGRVEVVGDVPDEVIRNAWGAVGATT